LQTIRLSALILETEPPANKVRLWTFRANSFRFEGAFLAIRGSKVHIHKVNGVKIVVPVEKLSAEDLEYVEYVTGQRSFRW
jgi:hypothetical protein